MKEKNGFVKSASGSPIGGPAPKGNVKAAAAGPNKNKGAVPAKGGPTGGVRKLGSGGKGA